MANQTKERQSSLSSDKLLAILECIAENRTPIRLQDLAEQSGITQSTVLRYLRTLQNANYVYQEEDTMRYGLTWKLCKLTEHLNTNVSLRNIARPFVAELANTLQLGVCLVVERNHQCIYLDCIDHPHPSYTPLQYIGKHAPLHATGSGKVLLAAHSNAEVEEYIATQGLVRCTERTITEAARLLDELEHVRQQGYAIDDEECESGLKCISYPIYCYASTVHAAISVFGNTDEMNDERCLAEVQAVLSKNALMISNCLGWTPKEPLDQEHRKH